MVEPEVAVDDKWAVPRDLQACPLLLVALYRHRILNLACVRPQRPTTVKVGWMGQVEWPTQSQSEPEAHLFVGRGSRRKRDMPGA